MEYTGDRVANRKQRAEEPNETEGLLDSVAVTTTHQPASRAESSSIEDDFLFFEEPDNEADVLPVEQRLMNYLLRNYERSVRPVKNASDTVFVRMGLTLTQIFDMVSRQWFILPI